jgi:hypothetical protein
MVMEPVHSLIECQEFGHNLTPTSAIMHVRLAST